MDTNRKILYFLIIFSALTLWSCEDYLEKTQKADISEEIVFSTFDNYQGFVETIYKKVLENAHSAGGLSHFNNGDDIIAVTYPNWINGAYLNVIAGQSQYPVVWTNSWYGIRSANLAIAHLKDLIEATDEQRQLIEGQAYFFRGYFHWELMKAWGNIPFVDTVFSADSDMRIPQKGLYTTAEMILKDLQKAADLLPADWDLTVTGQKNLGKNIGKATKGMALANMAECLLYCGSPLFNGVETGNYTYNIDYCKRASDAAWQVIQLANNGIYTLEPWATYKNNFYKKDNTFPVTKEIIFNSPENANCRYNTNSFNWGGNSFCCPTQNYVELFEMANGLPVDDPTSGHNLMNPWINRDPRFRYNITIDGDRIITGKNDATAFVQLYIGGMYRIGTSSITGFGYRKFWDETMNLTDNGWNNLRFSPPLIRLAEVYLVYAEMVNEAYGPTGTVPGSSLTAIDAVNIIRTRAGMPNVNAKFLGSPLAFRDRIWNERAVELAYENKRWYDLRRWHVHHLPKYTQLFELQFDKNHTYFNRVLCRTIQFSEQHYWLPFPTNQISLYPGWKQNPGW